MQIIYQLAGTILLGSSYYIYALNGIKNKILITLFILLPSLFITIVSQGRQVWLAVLIASILTPIIVAIISKKK